ncbi:hypothetical protein TUM12370_24450 [Salmonella enterica subsp. enterica serovar Choleraesuis]|nr:hypothetical protein TUM12370_24450 [Salmonella enterica subsp. enterica serovar Choleraesuis]
MSNPKQPPNYRDQIREIVSGYLSGEATEYEDELVDRLLGLMAPGEPVGRYGFYAGGYTSSRFEGRMAGEVTPGGYLLIK